MSLCLVTSISSNVVRRKYKNSSFFSYLVRISSFLLIRLEPGTPFGFKLDLDCPTNVNDVACGSCY